MGWDPVDEIRETVEPPADDEEAESTFGHCGIDVERFDRIVEQNNCGETEYADE